MALKAEGPAMNSPSFAGPAMWQLLLAVWGVYLNDADTSLSPQSVYSSKKRKGWVSIGKGSRL